MATAWHCDAPGCDSWTRHGYKHGFLKVSDGSDEDSHFCSWDCTMKFSSKFPPLEVVTPRSYPGA
jgi:hypothetical protein